MARPDFSDFLGHFTTSRKPVGHTNNNNPCNQYGAVSAKDRLISILNSKCIQASQMPWTGRLAVCFTECPWSSMLDHARAYSPYGVGFRKPHVFAAGGGPVYYVRADHWDKQQWEDHLKTFVTPFWPKYRPKKFKADATLSGKSVDYSHEREWRVPHDFAFDHKQIEFVIVDTYEDMAQFPKDLKDSIGREKFLIMDVYRNIERLWPVHQV